MAFSSALKVKLLRLFGAKIGKAVVLKPGVNIKYPWNLEIGDDTWIGEKVWLDSLVKIEIGQNVCISQGAFLFTGSHNYKKTSFDLLLDKIILEDGVWIGANAVVCPGVRCYSHSILTVNSVTTHDLDAFMVYQGNPALPKRKRVLA
jgi:putative colanic acid biosynthesis acetyltransferase WcaF